MTAIQESMKQLGFRLEDVKILLDSHGHSDHVGGHAIMKRLTGARVLEAKYARQHSRDVANPFIDPAGYQQYVSAQKKEYIAELAKQKAGGN